MECDVLVIGGGGAGMRAAIEAARLGCEVILADKGPVGRSGTTPMAMEAFQAVCLPEDSKELHFQDTVEGGRFLNDEKLVAVLVDRAPEAVKDLERFGIRFKKKGDGRYDPMHHAGQTLPRTLFIQGGGYGLMMGLLKESRRHRNLTILQDVMVIKILLEEGVPCGAIFLDLKEGELKPMKCKAVVLATGGYQELWSMNDAACTACGDGVFLAYEAGAELVDLEMMQFYPTVVIDPPSVKGTLFQYELVLDPEAFAGKLLNGRMETFIEGQPVRDKIIQLLWKEVREGRGSEHGGVYIDLVHSSKGRQELTEALEKWQPNQFHYLKDMGDFSGALWSSAERVVEENHKEKRINRISFQSVKKFSTIWQSYESPPQAPPHYYDEYLISMSINDSYKKYTNDSSVTNPKKKIDSLGG